MVESKVDIGIITGDPILGEMLQNVLNLEGITTTRERFEGILGGEQEGFHDFLKRLRQPGLIFMEWVPPFDFNLRLAIQLSDIAKSLGRKVILMSTTEGVLRNIERGSAVDLLAMPFEINDLYALVGKTLGRDIGY